MLRSKDVLPLIMDLYHVLKTLIQTESSTTPEQGGSRRGGKKTTRRRMRRLIPQSAQDSANESAAERSGEGDNALPKFSLRESIESASAPEMERAHRGELSLPKALAAAAKSIPQNLSTTRLTDAQLRRIVTRILTIGAECNRDPQWQEAWDETSTAMRELSKRWDIGRELTLRKHLLGEEVTGSPSEAASPSPAPASEGASDENQGKGSRCELAPMMMNTIRLLRAFRSLWKRLFGSELRELWHALEMDSMLEAAEEGEGEGSEMDQVKKAAKSWLLKVFTDPNAFTPSDPTTTGNSDSVMEDDKSDLEEPQEEICTEVLRTQEKERMIKQGIEILRRAGALMGQNDESYQTTEKIVKWFTKTGNFLRKDKATVALVRELIILGTDLILPNGQWKQRGILWKDIIQFIFMSLQSIEYWPIPAVEM